MENKTFTSYYKDRSLLNKFCLQVVLFLFFFNIPLHLFKIPFSSGKLVTIICIIYFIICTLVKKDFLIPKDYIKYIFGVFILYFIIFTVTDVIYSTPDNYYLNGLSFYIIEYLFGSYIIVTIFKLKSLNEVIESIILISVVQAFIMFGSLFIPSLKSFVVAVMEANPFFSNFSGADKIKDSFRGLSLTSDRTLGLSVFLSISIMLIYLLFILKKEKMSYLKYTMIFLLIFIGGVLAARTFFVGLFIGLLFMIVINRKFRLSSEKLKRYFRILLITIGSIISLIPIIINLFFAESKEEISLAFDWAFEIFFNLFNDGSLNSASNDDLMNNHLKVVPQDIQTFLIGDSNRTFVNGAHYMGMFTDSGYLRMIFAYGLIGSLAIYFFWIYICIKTSKLYSKEEGIGVFISFIALLFFITQIKFDLFPGGSINLKIIVLFFVFGVERKLSEKKRNKYQQP